MKIQQQEITLKNGRKLLIRSPEPTDTKNLLSFLKVQNGETHFMASYPEEWDKVTEETESSYLKAKLESSRNFDIAAFDGDKLIANCGIGEISPKIKLCHRAGFGIGILAEYCNTGLGTILINKCIEHAKRLNYTQIELTVYEDNIRAFHLYQKTGFKVTGTTPRSFRLKDGTYLDAIHMIYLLD